MEDVTPYGETEQQQEPQKKRPRSRKTAQTDGQTVRLAREIDALTMKLAELYKAKAKTEQAIQSTEQELKAVRGKLLAHLQENPNIQKGDQ